MIKNKSDRTITLYLGDQRLIDLEPGWSHQFHPEIEDFLMIKYADVLEKTPLENALIEKIKEMIKPKKVETKSKRTKRGKNNAITS